MDHEQDGHQCMALGHTAAQGITLDQVVIDTHFTLSTNKELTELSVQRATQAADPQSVEEVNVLNFVKNITEVNLN